MFPWGEWGSEGHFEPFPSVTSSGRGSSAEGMRAAFIGGGAAVKGSMLLDKQYSAQTGPLDFDPEHNPTEETGKLPLSYLCWVRCTRRETSQGCGCGFAGCWALSPKFTSSTCLVLVERMGFAETRPPASNYFPPLNASSAKALQRPILSLCVGRDFTHVFVALLVLAALPRMQFTLSKYSSPFPAITLIPSPNATGQISNKTDWRNRLSSYTDKEVVNSSPGKNWLSERFSFSQIWYSRACRTSRGDKLSLGKPFISPTQTSAVCIMSIM